MVFSTQFIKNKLDLKREFNFKNCLQFYKKKMFFHEMILLFRCCYYINSQYKVGVRRIFGFAFEFAKYSLNVAICIRIRLNISESSK